MVAIHVNGSDANAFLQGQLSIDINATPIPKRGCYLSRKGRIISLFYLTQSDDDFVLFMPRDISEVFIKQISKYIMRSDVTIAINASLVIALEQHNFNALTPDYFTSKPHITLGDQVIALLTESEVNQFKQALNSKDIHVIGDWLWHKNQLQNEIPSIYPSTIAKFLPHELSLHTKNILDFDKGCYIGQEIIARMHYKATLKYHLKQITTEPKTQLLPGDDWLVNQKKSGTIVDSFISSESQCIYLVCLKKEDN
jgi:tRNA-modifying protein YgfZ